MIEKSDLPKPAAAGRGLGKMGRLGAGTVVVAIASRLGETLWLVVRAADPTSYRPALEVMAALRLLWPAAPSFRPGCRAQRLADHGLGSRW